MRAVVVVVGLCVGGSAVAAPAFVHVPRAGEPRRHPRLEAATVGAWTAQRDPETGVVRRMWGAPVAAAGALANPALALAAAKRFVGAHLADLAPGASPAELVPVSNELLDRGSRRIVAFRQTARGLRVVGGQVHVVIAADRIVAAGSEAWPDVVAPSELRIEVAAALAPVAADVRWPVTLTRGERVIVPVAGGFREADAFEARAAPRAWRVYVAADGTVLGRESEVAFDSGTLVYSSARWPGEAHVDAPAVQANIVVDGVAQTTGSDGSFTYAAVGSPVTVGPTGAVVRVTNAAGPTAAADLAAAPTTRWSAATDEQTDAQLETYVYGTRIAAKVASFAPDLAAFLAGPLAFSVDEPDSCNAYSDGSTEHFFQSSAACENTGRLEDVVMHEFGHAVHFHSVIDGAGVYRSDISEGFADFNATNALDDPRLGVGFRYTADPERTLAPANHVAHYPEDDVPDPHIASLTLSGALWDLRTRLVAELGADAGVAAAERIYVGTMQLAADLPTAYAAALVADDDNGDLSDGTPHRCEIDAAFGRHGLGPAGFATTIVATPLVADAGTGIIVDVPTTTPALTAPDGCAAPQVMGVAITLDGTTTPLDPDGNGHWRAILPAQLAGTVLHYSVRATFDDDSYAIFPDNPADPEYELLAGVTGDTLQAIQCTSLDDSPFPAWTATDDQWMWGEPSAPTAGIDDPPSAHTGTHVIGTGIGLGGAKYLAGATTTLTMPLPTLGAFDYDSVHVQFWRWLSVEDSSYDRATISVGDTVLWQNPTNVQQTLDLTDREWRLVDVDVTHAVGAGLTWTLAADPVDSLGGWAIDDVCVIGVNPVHRPPLADDVHDPLGGGGCCDAGGDPRGAGLVLLATAMWLRRRRRRRRRLR